MLCSMHPYNNIIAMIKRLMLDLQCTCRGHTGTCVYVLLPGDGRHHECREKLARCWHERTPNDSLLRSTSRANSTLPCLKTIKQRFRDEAGVPPGFQKRQKQKNNTQDSNVVPHRSTNWARRCLTSQSERDAVLSSWCGRSWLQRRYQII